MAVTLNASTTTGLVQSADTSGTIELQNNGTTRLTVNSSGATIPTATVTTLNTPTGVLATQNGMTGIAKAWVRFRGGSSPTIDGSFNISSITRTGQGQYTVNFTTAMPNTNYSAAIGNSIDTSFGAYVDGLPFIQAGSPYYSVPTTTSFDLRYAASVNGTAYDPYYGNVVIFSS